MRVKRQRQRRVMRKAAAARQNASHDFRVSDRGSLRTVAESMAKAVKRTAQFFRSKLVLAGGALTALVVFLNPALDAAHKLMGIVAPGESPMPPSPDPPVSPRPEPNPKPSGRPNHLALSLEGGSPIFGNVWVNAAPQARLSVMFDSVVNVHEPTLFLGRLAGRDSKIEHHIVESKYLGQSASGSATSWSAVADLASVIADRFSEAPHGLYEIFVSCGEHPSDPKHFALAFGADFAIQPWEQKAERVFSIEGSELVMTHKPGRAGYSTIFIEQRFDFAHAFCATGSFSAEQYEGQSVAMELSFVDVRTGDIVAAIAQVGQASRVELKSCIGMRSAECGLTSPACDVVDHLAGTNYFRIEAIALADGAEIRLWIDQQPILSESRPTLKHFIASADVIRSLDRVQLRLWNAGRIRVRNLIVTEIAPDRRPT